ncbi:MAG: hypothetical protein Q8O56_13990 [Solirubrobacteraceae bacterium]|nr:hypothetical protein [Solirubrobacteraceae bacterium]
MKRNIVIGSPDVVTSIRLSAVQHARLKKLAASQHRSLTQQMRVIVDAALDAAACPEGVEPVLPREGTT